MNTEPSKREEMPRPTGWQAAQIALDNPRMVKVVFETPECAEAFIDGIEPADGPIVAATRMRERCVEKVRELGEQWRQEASKAGRMFSDKTAIATKIAAELQSLTLDGERERTKS